LGARQGNEKVGFWERSPGGRFGGPPPRNGGKLQKKFNRYRILKAKGSINIKMVIGFWERSVWGRFGGPTPNKFQKIKVNTAF